MGTQYTYTPKSKAHLAALGVANDIGHVQGNRYGHNKLREEQRQLCVASHLETQTGGQIALELYQVGPMKLDYSRERKYRPGHCESVKGPPEQACFPRVEIGVLRQTARQMEQPR